MTRVITKGTTDDPTVKAEGTAYDPPVIAEGTADDASNS